MSSCAARGSSSVVTRSSIACSIDWGCCSVLALLDCWLKALLQLVVTDHSVTFLCKAASHTDSGHRQKLQHTRWQLASPTVLWAAERASRRHRNTPRRPEHTVTPSRPGTRRLPVVSPVSSRACGRTAACLNLPTGASHNLARRPQPAAWHTDVNTHARCIKKDAPKRWLKELRRTSREEDKSD